MCRVRTRWFPATFRYLGRSARGQSGRGRLRRVAGGRTLSRTVAGSGGAAMAEAGGSGSGDTEAEEESEECFDVVQLPVGGSVRWVVRLLVEGKVWVSGQQVRPAPLPKPRGAGAPAELPAPRRRSPCSAQVYELLFKPSTMSLRTFQDRLQRTLAYLRDALPVEALYRVADVLELRALKANGVVGSRCAIVKVLATPLIEALITRCKLVGADEFRRKVLTAARQPPVAMQKVAAQLLLSAAEVAQLPVAPLEVEWVPPPALVAQHQFAKLPRPLDTRFAAQITSFDTYLTTKVNLTREETVRARREPRKRLPHPSRAPLRACRQPLLHACCCCLVRRRCPSPRPHPSGGRERFPRTPPSRWPVAPSPLVPPPLIDKP
jgi:hypothetical protein